MASAAAHPPTMAACGGYGRGVPGSGPLNRYKLQSRTYMILISMLLAFTSLLVVALAATPSEGQDYLIGGDGGDAGDLVAPGDGSLIADYRVPIMTVSAVGILGTGAALAFSGGVKYIDRRNVLESAVRREMFEYIKSNPGTYLREISRSLDINPTNTTWHLRKLGEADLVRGQMINGLKLYYPIEGGIQTKNTAVASAILKNDNAKTIVAYLLAHPGAHQREIARALSVNHGTVRWHLKKLVTANVVNEHPEGAAYKYYISTSGMETLGATSEMADAVAENAAQSTASRLTEPTAASAEVELEPDSGL